MPLITSPSSHCLARTYLHAESVYLENVPMRILWSVRVIAQVQWNTFISVACESGLKARNWLKRLTTMCLWLGRTLHVNFVNHPTLMSCEWLIKVRQKMERRKLPSFELLMSSMFLVLMRMSRMWSWTVWMSTHLSVRTPKLSILFTS